MSAVRFCPWAPPFLLQHPGAVTRRGDSRPSRTALGRSPLQAAGAAKTHRLAPVSAVRFCPWAPNFLVRYAQYASMQICCGTLPRNFFSLLATCHWLIQAVMRLWGQTDLELSHASSQIGIFLAKAKSCYCPLGIMAFLSKTLMIPVLPGWLKFPSPGSIFQLLRIFRLFRIFASLTGEVQSS